MTHWVLGGALLLIGLFVIIALIMIRTQAQDVTVDISNATPTLSGGTAKIIAGTTASTDGAITAAGNVDPITLTAGTTTAYSFVITATDTNGVADLDTEATGIYFEDTTTAACSADNNDCYRDIPGAAEACQKVAIDATNTWYRCDFQLEYYTNASSDGAEAWDVDFSVEDAADAGATYTAYTNEISELVAGTFPTVAFGSLALGASTTAGTNQDVTHQNQGNDVIDYDVNLDDATIDCTTGTIPVGNVGWSTDVGGGDADSGSDDNTLTAVAQDLDIDIAVRTADGGTAGPNNPVVGGDDSVYSYWNISIPASGVLGSCTEGLTVAAKAN